MRKAESGRRKAENLNEVVSLLNIAFYFNTEAQRHREKAGKGFFVSLCPSVLK